MKNRIGINLWNWTDCFNDSGMKWIDHVAHLGFSSIEIGMNVTDFDYAEVRRRVEMNGLLLTLCGAFTQGRDISNFSEEIRNNTEKYMTDCFIAAEKMGAKLFVGPVYAGGKKRHLLTDDDAKREWELAVSGLRKMAAIAQECGVTIALEPINRYSTSVVNTVDQALQMLLDIGCPNVQILFDTYHANIEENNVCDALEKVCASGSLVHFHACENHRGAPGTGSQPWEKLIGILKKYNYRGSLTMEMFPEGFMDGSWQKEHLSRDDCACEGRRQLEKLLSE